MRLERLEFNNPIFAVWQGAGDRDEPVTYSFGQHEPYWTGGWYGETVRAEGDEWFDDQDPAEYMRPAAEYEMGFGYDPDADPAGLHGTFTDTQTYTWSDDLTGSFNVAAEGEQPWSAAAAGEDEDEDIGAHGPGQGFGPGPSF